MYGEPPQPTTILKIRYRFSLPENTQFRRTLFRYLADEGEVCPNRGFRCVLLHFAMSDCFYPFRQSGKIQRDAYRVQGGGDSQSKTWSCGSSRKRPRTLLFHK